MNFEELQTTCIREKIRIATPAPNECALRKELRTHFGISSSMNPSPPTIQKTGKPITITFGPKTADEMLGIDLPQQARLRGLVTFRNNRFAGGRELRARIIEHDSALSHPGAARKTEFAKLGATQSAEIRQPCSQKGIAPHQDNKNTIATL